MVDGKPANFAGLSKWPVNGLVYVLAHQLRAHHIAVVGVSPAAARPDRWVMSGKDLQSVYDALRTGSVPETDGGESPEYTGRAVVALAADPNVMQKSGKILWVSSLAREYGFTDIDGRQPE